MKDKDFEQVLLNKTSLDDLIKRKIEHEFVLSGEQAKIKPRKKRVSDIGLAPKELIFSKQAVFKVYNKNSQTESYINGIQAEALLGLQSALREKIAQGGISSFVTNDAYVKFDYVEYNEINKN